MRERLRSYIDALFEEAPQTRKTVELKEEMLQNLEEKYEDLLAEGKSEEAAYNIAVASVGDITELLRELEHGAAAPDPEAERARTRSAILTAAAIALYILSIIPLLLLQNELGLVVMFAVAAVATGLIIFNGMTQKKYARADDTVVEEFREWKAETGRDRQAQRSISGAVWSLTLVVYLVVSFLTGRWELTWLCFPIAGAVDGVIKAIFDLRRK